MPDFEDLYDKLGHSFRDKALPRRALTHCSAGRDNNERLEFLGDSILGFLVGEELYRRFPQASEGDLSRLRAGLVQKGTLAALARELGLGDFLILGAGEMKSGGARRESILADALEAVICALYLDSGLEACRAKVLEWFDSRFGALGLDESLKDAKTRLQEYLQARRQQLPHYAVQKVSGKDHAQLFAVSCRVAGLAEPVLGRGGTRREAEQQAAEQALRQLGVLS